MDTELSQQPPTQLAFIFNNVANYAQLVAAFHAGVEVHVLDAAQDGLGQMAAILEGRSSIEALHVIGHGAQGSLNLGSMTLDSATIGSHGEVLGRIGSALVADGDILLYGCDVGADALGAQFVGAIAQATGADVAASTDKTGGAQLGGNWTLEHRTGLVAAGGALQISAISSLDTLLAPAVKDVTDSSQKSPGIFVPGFTLTTSEGVVGDPDPAVDGIYFDESGKTASFTVTADGSSVATFDLTGMTFLKLLDVYPHFRITITGHKANGGTATAMIEFALNSTTPTTPDSFSDMTGLTSFDVTINVVTVEGGGAYDLTLDAFTVDNVAAPAPGTPDLLTGSDIGLSNLDNITSANAVGFSGTGVTGASVLVFIDKNGNGVYDAGTDVSSTATASGGAWNVSGLSTLGLNGSYKVYAQQTVSGSVSGLSTALDVTIDHTAPTLAITSNKSTLKAGETATVTFTFTEDPGTSFDASDIVVSGGTLSGLTTTGTTRTATFTPTANTNSGTASITVASGRYTDTAGNNGSAGATPSLTFDTRAPTVTVSSSSTSLLVGQTATITFTFSEDPGASFTWNGSSGDVVVTGGTLSAVSGSGTTRTATFTANGSNTTAGIQVNANSYADTAGNLGAGGSSPSITVVIDSTPPAAPSTPDLISGSDSGSANNDNLTNDTTPSFTGTAEAGATVRLYDGATQVGSGTADGSGNWTITTSTLSAGAHSITAVATDAAGNTGAASAALAITIDTSQPTLAITSNTATLKGGETATITFTFNEDPGASFALADVTVTGGALSALGGTGLVRTATFTPAANTNGGTASITVAGGAYIDAAGNLGGAGSTPALTFDTLAPTLAITSNMPSLAIGETATITFTFSEDPGASFALADVSVTGGALSALTGTGLVRTATFTPAADTNGGNASIGVAGGAYTDAAGNSGVAASVAVAYDTLAPSAPSAPMLDAGSDTGLSASDQLTNDTTPTVSGTAEAGATVKLYDGATEVGSTTADGSGNWSITSSALSAGPHSLTAVATDAAGNTGPASAALSVTIDTSQPTLAISSDKSSLNGGETAAITFTFSEDPGTSFSADDIVVAGGTIGELSGTGLTRTATFTPAVGSNGAASITVAGGTYADAAGNLGAAGTSPSLSFDMLAPSLAITSDKASLAIGETATITFTFSEAPGVSFDLSDVAVSGGTLSALSGTGLVRTATFTPAANTNGGNASIGVAAGAYADAAGNGGAAGSVAVAFDTLAPLAPSALALSAGSDTGLSASDQLTNDTTPTVNGTAEAGAIVKLYDGVTEVGRTTADGSGNWSITSSALPAGAHSLTAVATDAAGNTGVASAALSITIDTSSPTLAISSDKASLKGGETAIISFTFSEDPGASFTLADIEFAGGTLGELSGTGLTRIATFTPAVGSNGAARITVAGGAYTDAAGNLGAAGTTPTLSFDTLAPTLSITSDKTALKISETATITFSFSEDPGASFTLADITVVGGILGELAASGTTRTALFTPTSNVNGGSASITVDGGAYTDLAGNAGSAGEAPAMSFDTLAPAASTPDLVADSDTGASNSDNFTTDTTPTFAGAAEDGATVTLYDGATVIGATVASGGAWTITSSTLTTGVHAISTIVTDAAGNASVQSSALEVKIDTAPAPDTSAPTSTVAISDRALTSGETATVTISFSEAVTGFDLSDVSASSGTLGGLSTADGGRTWTATFTPAPGLAASENTIRVLNAGVTDIAGNAGSGVSASENYSVMTRGLSASIDISDNELKAGEQAQVTISFSEAVTRFTRTDLNTPNAQLSKLSSLDGGKTWTALLTPDSGIKDPSNVITLDLGGVSGKGGVPGAGSATSANYTVSTKRPTASVEMASKTLAQGASAELTIRFSEAVTGFDLADMSSSAGSISGLSSSDGITWTATLTASSGLKPATVGIVTLDVAGVQNADGNSGTGKASSKPYVVLPPNATPVRVDGVETYTQPISTSTGAPGQLIVVPATGADRNEDPGTPNSTLADIPLAAPGQAGGGVALYASLPAGIGLQAEGPSLPLDRNQALQDLIDRIESRTAPGSSSQQEMSGQGSSFLEAIGDSTMVQTQTIVLTSDSRPGAGAPIAVTGAAPSAGNVVGLVIDGSALPSGSTLQLDHVQFAAIVGDLRVIGGAGRNIVVGDSGRQTIFLGEDDDVLSGGGGDDIIGSAGGDDVLDGGSGNDLVAGGIGNDILKGGSGEDILNGGRSVMGEWSFFLSAGGVISARHTNAALTLTGSEQVAAAEFDNASPELAFLVANAQQLEGVALLYAALDRAPDLAGLSFWSRAGVSLREVAEGVLRSAEWGATPLGQAGDDAFVRGMYQDLLGRAVDEAGMAFWMGRLSSGAATRSDVLMAAAFSSEHRAGALTQEGYLIGQESLVHERGWLSSSGDDRLEGGSGNDQLVGGDGFDTAVFAGARHNYRILVGADGTLRVADGIDRTVDTLSGIEALEFGDGTFDLSFLAHEPDLLGAAGLLYQAVLDRAGDAAGLAWWLGLGLQAQQMAQAFAGSSEFQARFGAMSDAELVRALYANSGLDASAAGGMAAWENYLHGHSRAELVAAWIGEDSVQAAHYGNDGIWLL